MKNLKNNSITKLYILLSLISYFVISIIIIVSKGRLFASFFFMDRSDTGMDFFHSIVEVSSRCPYEDFGVIYPPFANMIFYVLSLFISETIKANWPQSHSETIYMVGTTDDLRLHQSSIFLYIVFIVLFVLLFISLINIIIKMCDVSYSFLFSICICFSFGVIFALERGNVIIYAMIMAVYFLLKYDSEKKWERELAYIAIACAFGLKIYPIVFSIILLKEKKIKGFLKVGLYSLLSLVPIFVFGGLKVFIVWINNIIEFNKNKIPAYGFPFRIIIIILCLFLFLSCREALFKKFVEKKSFLVLLLTFLMYMLINDNYGYSLIYMVIPFLFFVIEEKDINKHNIWEFLMYLFVLIPYGVNQLSSFLIIIGIIGGIIRCIDIEKNQG